jgi:hypothetical protein
MIQIKKRAAKSDSLVSEKQEQSLRRTGGEIIVLVGNAGTLCAILQ